MDISRRTCPTKVWILTLLMWLREVAFHSMLIKGRRLGVLRAAFREAGLPFWGSVSGLGFLCRVAP